MWRECDVQTKTTLINAAVLRMSLVTNWHLDVPKEHFDEQEIFFLLS